MPISTSQDFLQAVRGQRSAERTFTVDPVLIVETGDEAAETSEVTSTQLLVETLVEEVSIDGMCGVY